MTDVPLVENSRVSHAWSLSDTARAQQHAHLRPVADPLPHVLDTLPSASESSNRNHLAVRFFVVGCLTELMGERAMEVVGRAA